MFGLSTPETSLHPLKSNCTPLFLVGFRHFLHLSNSIIIYAPTQTVKIRTKRQALIGTAKNIGFLHSRFHTCTSLYDTRIALAPLWNGGLLLFSAEQIDCALRLTGSKQNRYYIYEISGNYRNCLKILLFIFVFSAFIASFVSQNYVSFCFINAVFRNASSDGRQWIYSRVTAYHSTRIQHRTASYLDKIAKKSSAFFQACFKVFFSASDGHKRFVTLDI